VTPMRTREHGFTLVELVAVLLVLAVVAGLGAARIGVGRDRDALQMTAYQIAARCRAARAAAIRLGSQELVLVDMANRMVSTAGARAPMHIPSSITVHSQTSADEQRSASVAGILFLPDGSSSGGSVRLEAGTRAFEIRINWFTGRVSVDRTS
jgi:general secretion pathway protein H